jgi:hypothetical protein
LCVLGHEPRATNHAGNRGQTTVSPASAITGNRGLSPISCRNRGLSPISCLLPDPRFELIRHDVTFPLYVEVDEITNLACPAAPIHYQYDPVQTARPAWSGPLRKILARRHMRIVIRERGRARLQRASSCRAQLHCASTSVPGTINMPGLPRPIDYFRKLPA